MKAAFDEFIRQHKMTGSQKADGYSTHVLERLMGREKDIAFNLLEQELPWSAHWIFLIDAERAVAVLKAQEQALRGDPHGDVYMIQQNLVSYTGDLLYQKHMIEDYPNYIEKKRPLVVDAVHRTPANADTVSFFRRVILFEVNPNAVARASRHLLDSLGFSCATELSKKDYDQLTSHLRSEDDELKQKALKQIGVVA